MQLELPRTDASHVQQVVDQPHEMLELPVHHVERAHQPRIRIDLARDLQPVAQRRQWIAQFVRERRQEFVLAAVGGAQRLFGLDALGDVREQQRHLVLGRRSRARREHIEPAPERARALHEAERLAGFRHASIDVEPVLLMQGRKLAHPFARDIGETGLLLEAA